jgi:hypothetical protein
MKSWRSYLLITVFGLSTIFAPSLSATTIEIYIRTHPKKTGTRQRVTVNPDGTANVKLSAPGNYTITYAEGPNKGKVIWSGEVTKAETVTMKGDFTRHTSKNQ